MHEELSMSAIAFEVMIEACSDPEGSGHRSVSIRDAKQGQR
jgi:cyanate lyase